MPGTRLHKYRIENRWTGNLGSGTSAYTAYSRNHELSGGGKSAVVPGSSDPAFRGDPARYNPEELLLAAASACHMLWVLHRCSDAGITVTEYADDAYGEMVEQALAEIARGLVRRGVRQLVVAGGETSGAVVQALGIEQMRIGAQIDPGVPWCHAAALACDAQLHIALKSGNFGAGDFFRQSFALLA